MNSTKGNLAIQPYVFFDGRCDEALEFYKNAVGAEVVQMMRFKDAPPGPSSGDCAPPPGSAEKVMHATVKIGDSVLLASDGMCGGTPKFEGFSLSLTVPDDQQAETAFRKLSEGGAIEMPLGPTFFTSKFGMLRDKFGVAWMVYVLPKQQP